MSDSFADLWNSTGASKPAEPPKKLGSLTPSPAPARSTQNDVFAMLASAGSSSPASRSQTPGAATGTTQPTRSLGANGAPANPRPAQKAASSGGDAFSGLFSGALAPSSTNGAKMTIAERAAQAERDRLAQLQQQHAAAQRQASAWAGLDSLGGFSSGGQTSSVQSATSNAQSSDLDDWAFGFETAKPSAPSTSSKPPSAQQDDWGDLLSQPTTTKPASTKPPTTQNARSLLDFEEFESPVAQTSQSVSELGGSRSNTPGDFDFGDREDRLLDDNSDEDDILGELGKPVSERPPAQTRPDRRTPSPNPLRSGQKSRAVSPPPHVLGQIVEMGFSVQQARIALAATDTGLDVQAALETLLSNGAASEQPTSERAHDERRTRESGREPGWERYYESDEERPRRGQAAPARGAPRAPPRDGPSPAASGEAQRALQEHADKLLAQASELGLNMFNRANALWREGKEKALRAYEEHAVAARAAEPATRGARPRWMQDGAEDGADGHAPREERGGFRGDDEVLPPRPKPQPRPKPRQAEERPPQAQQPSTSARAKTGSLLSDDPPAVYVSPFRRKTPARSQAPVPAEPVASASKPPARAPSPVPLIQRKTVSAPAAALAASSQHKAAGTEMFKLGRYAEAEAAYSAAIGALPAGHLLLVPLLNNRALARLKTGDHAGVVEDCTAVVSMVGAGYHPSREARVEREEDGAGVDLGEGLVKALWRRAEAYEGREKWELARQDWEAIAAKDFAGKTRMDAVTGAGRCRRMLAADAAPSAPASSSAPPAPKPRPKAKVVKPAVVVSDAALNRVREANQAAEAEDQLKHELKDVVDARLAAWKNGKETNIRALIASLDTVLWPELGWQKVGMHELVTPAQVKIRYTKAIAKLHPDKLNVNNTTLEQRMVANGVFGSLNDAWNAFKQ
ncbi:hypothetical protein WOLCODRAFT_117539 [Wolfiporia cocos MD-104 SS10]|uniref:UBA domain-containing protein n=1 Tax=Wolfiporia cocos (strain MD-104) TaxID=742152 RepID=A0A2H3JLJ0_WOLCO|nr:hypothetical protein WOLCODRAFT_117539 [Wolfiporia cocos MD-104 SS10]